MKNFIKKNKIKVIFFSILLGIFIILLLMVYPLYGTKGNSKYGNRLDGIDEVKIEDSTIKNVSDKIKESIPCDKVSTDLKGRIFNIIININSDASIDAIKEFMPSILDEFSEDQINYYDFQFFVTGDDKSMIGYKNKESKYIIWTNN